MKNTLKSTLQVCLAAFLLLATTTSLPAQTPASELVDINRLDSPPTPKKPPKLKFRKRGITGEVVLRFIVNKDGQLEKLSIVSFNDPDFIDPALQAYENIAYNPGVFAGKPVATWVNVTVTFPAK